MSSTQTHTETTQECCARLLREQAEHQREHELEAARQEEEFTAEMQRLEEEVVREAEEQRIAEEKKKEEERLAEERITEQEKQEEARRAQAQDTAFHRMVEESRKEKAKAAQELAERWERAASAASRRMGTTALREPLGSKQKIYKSTAIVRDSSEEEIAEGKEKEKGVTPRGVKRNRIRMVGQIGGPPGGDSNPGSGDDEDDKDDEEEDSGTLNKAPCLRCVSQGRPLDCRPQSGGRKTQACIVCHRQWQRCSWSGNNVSRRSQTKQPRIDIAEKGEYLGDARRIAEKKFGGVEFGEKLDGLERRLGALERREEREMGKENTVNEEEEEEEEKDGEGEEEEKSEEEKREEIREGKKRVE
ncbi:hypothetical protein F5050DRAFT_1803843 [Lentinula boryana]|uniref:Uncharacterized protein n=1 Tax=Lentinula boryana TaxID=40481 RepID=A0ABQ8QQ40_9AGAR|nr:hypothetical protein F5050DRAFT_1803843 [Lentinula boryana]